MAVISANMIQIVSPEAEVIIVCPTDLLALPVMIASHIIVI